MAKVVRLGDSTDRPNEQYYAISCPGCHENHMFIVPRWTFNGDMENPTISPSLLVRSGHYIPEHAGDCRCDYNKAHAEEPAPFKCYSCHSFIRDGKIQFLSDSTHELTGQTVDLPDYED